MRLLKYAIFLSLAGFLTTAALASQEHVIVLSEGELVIDGEPSMSATIETNVGDVLHVFHSDPDFSHDFFIEDEDYNLESGSISYHGDHHDIALTHAKTFEIECYQMDNMIITIVVNP